MNSFVRILRLVQNVELEAQSEFYWIKKKIYILQQSTRPSNYNLEYPPNQTAP